MDKLVEDDVSWVIPAMKHMNEIFGLYPEGASTNKNPATTYRAQIIKKLQNERQLVVRVCDSLTSYMEKVRLFVKGNEKHVKLLKLLYQFLILQ